MVFRALIRKLSSGKGKSHPPASGYNLWAEHYDHESGNLMIELDRDLFASLLSNVSLAGRAVADVGCGTGRNWPLLISRKPATLIGLDVSSGMLERLTNKYPDASVRLVSDHKLGALEDESLDVIVSNLALAHFQSLDLTFNEWNRVLKISGDILITDYHPESLVHGATVSFAYKGRRLAINHQIYTFDMIRNHAKAQGWTEVALEERVIDESVRHHYVSQQASHIYEAFKGKAIIYAIHFRKEGARG